MERTLSLVLDRENRISLTLMKGEAYDIDVFTTKFEDSEALRKYFETEISTYLQQNQAMIQGIEERNGKKYRGSICVLEAKEISGSLIIEKVKVLYKKHLAIYKKIMYDPNAMRQFIRLSEMRAKNLKVVDFTPEFIKRIITVYKITSVADKQKLNSWLGKSSSQAYYEKIRFMINAYEETLETCKGKGMSMKSIDALYKDYVKEKQKKAEEKQEKSRERQLKYMKPEPANTHSTEDTVFIIGGMRYFMDDVPFDIDELAHLDTTYVPDGIGKTR